MEALDDLNGLTALDGLAALRTNEYTYRVPTPPRIVVPPPSFNANAVHDFRLSNSSPYLSHVSYERLIAAYPVPDWCYERRREAQMILPYLYLGPMVAAKDRAFLQREHITMVLGIRHLVTSESKLTKNALRVANELGLQASTVDLIDNQQLIAAFPIVTNIITQHLAQIHEAHITGQENAPAMAKILMFCESGNERSAGAVAAYIMETHHNVDYITAMQLCQVQRFCVNFDDSMKRVLQSYWDIVQARRDVGTGQSTGLSKTSTVSQKSSKRSLAVEDDYADGEMGDIGATADSARFQNRNFTPFVDMSP